MARHVQLGKLGPHLTDTPLGYAARRAALTLLSGVLVDHRMLSDQLVDDAPVLQNLSGPERARAQTIVNGVLRNLEPLDAVIDTYLDRSPPLRARNALRIAGWEILVDGVSAHAAVDMAVSLVRSGQKTERFSGLTNAVARKLAGSQDIFAATPTQKLPKALRTPLVKAYGKARAQAIEVAHTQEPPLDITLRDGAKADEWAATLGAKILPTGSLRLSRAGQVTTLPGYDEGAWWVQDAAAAIPARLLGNVAGKTALDLCAAPGGKTMQLAAGGAQVTAVDSSAQRLERLRENLTRTRLSAEIIRADLLKWEPDAAVDVIVLDAPCSATGTIRRHPDLPHLREHSDLRPIFSVQERLLSRALSWLKPGGRLVYCTCSLFPNEGEAQIAKIGESASVVPVSATEHGVPPEFVTSDGFFRTTPEFWPDDGGIDGFFAAILRKNT